MKAAFGSDDPMVVARIILEEGELQVCELLLLRLRRLDSQHDVKRVLASERLKEAPEIF